MNRKLLSATIGVLILASSRLALAFGAAYRPCRGRSCQDYARAAN